jgi:outer membrane protein OmpA-like peptidoglycan-associated protein
VFDTDGYFVGLSAVPWSVRIPHEEVTFATDSATIESAEAPKLEKSLALIADALAKHRTLGRVTLFIAGHTDTVGNGPYNLKLSQRRAQAIASWFRKRGLRIPIAFEGFGEQALLVATPDETNEPRNRRVDYILAVEEPGLKATGFRPTWKRVP